MSATLDMVANSLIRLEIIVLLRKQCPDLSLQITTGQLAQCYRVAEKNKDKNFIFHSICQTVVQLPQLYPDRQKHIPNTQNIYEKRRAVWPSTGFQM